MSLTRDIPDPYARGGAIFQSFTDRSRQQVVELLYGHREAGLAAAPPPAAADELTGRLISIVKRLDAIERRLRPSDAG